MPFDHLHTRWDHRALAGFLVLAMLLAQWSGFQHRILHGMGQGAGATAALASANSSPGSQSGQSGESVYHSCAAFDAAALGTTIHCAPGAGPLLPGTQVLALWLAFASWNAPFVHHFLSRAPPVV